MTKFLDRPVFWIALLCIAWVFAIYSAVFLKLLNSPVAMVSDDARHFVVWLRQLADPELFKGDVIAEYFQSLTPALYTLLYSPAILLGVDAIVWHFLVICPLTCIFFTLTAYRFLSHFLPTVRETGLATILLCIFLMSWPLVGLPRSFAFSIIFLSLSAFMEKRI